MIHVKREPFDKLFQHHKRPLFQEVMSKVSSPRSTFAKKHVQMKTAAEEEIYGVVDMTADKHVEFLVRLSNAETEATIWSIADTDSIVSQLEREIYGMSSNQQMRFKTKSSIRLIKIQARWQAISVQELRKPVE